jgi:hypothetical protein
MHVNSGTPHVAVEADGDAWSSEREHSIHTKLIPSRVSRSRFGCTATLSSYILGKVIRSEHYFSISVEVVLVGAAVIIRKTYSLCP